MVYRGLTRAYAGTISTEFAEPRPKPAPGSTAMKIADAFPALLESFFIDRLMRQRQVSPHTLASYRDTFRLLVQYAQRRLRKAPSDLTMPDLDPARRIP